MSDHMQALTLMRVSIVLQLQNPPGGLQLEVSCGQDFRQVYKLFDVMDVVVSKAGTVNGSQQSRH